MTFLDKERVAQCRASSDSRSDTGEAQRQEPYPLRGEPAFLVRSADGATFETGDVRRRLATAGFGGALWQVVGADGRLVLEALRPLPGGYVLAAGVAVPFAWLAAADRVHDLVVTVTRALRIGRGADGVTVLI